MREPIYISSAVDVYQKSTDTAKRVLMQQSTYALCEVQVKCEVLWSLNNYVDHFEFNFIRIIILKELIISEL